MTRPRYKRILLKLSGEALMGGRRTGIDSDTLASISDDIVEVQAAGVEIAIVIGGGNIFRGVTAATEGIDRVAGDHMGMLATVINAIALQDALERRGAHTGVTSAITMSEFAEPFIRRPIATCLLMAALAFVGMAAYPFLPVRYLLKDSFHSDIRIVKVTAPLLIMHGARDTTIPIAFGERLFATARDPKQFVRFDAGGHADLGSFGAIETARQFIDALKG